MSYIKSYGIALPHFKIEDVVLHPKGKKGVTKVTLELKIKTSTGKEKSLKFNFAGTRGKK